MRVLVVGSGGREHAICCKLKESSQVEKLYCIPGNAGIAQIATCANYSVMDFDGIVGFCLLKKIDLCFVAPDDPLSGGLVDRLLDSGIKAFGPTKRAALIEGSKAFSKDFMKKYNIPTAKYLTVEDYETASKIIETSKYPLVVKADGLALGKGVIICNNVDEGRKAIDDMMIDKAFGKAGNKIVIEEFMVGKEVSVLAFTDGKTVKCMPSSQDHKRAFDNDKGLNTGGMGAFSPSKAYTKEMHEIAMQTIIMPTIKGMEIEDRTFKGVLYFGLMLTSDGIKVLEYNARFGDPETQAVLPLLKTDFIDIINAIIDGKLDSINIEWQDKCSVVVVLASGGYPENYAKGYPITFDSLDSDITVFHAGTAIKNDELVTNGGRVLGVQCFGDTIEEAREKIYNNIKKINFKDMQYRSDIGIKL